MRTVGFTLIELMVVISIISIMSLVGFASFTEYSASQYKTKALGVVQSALRLAQSNATTSTVCNDVGGVKWFLIFKVSTIELACNLEDNVQKTYTLDFAEIEEIKCGSQTIGLPVTLTYAPGGGKLTFSPTCLSDDSWTFTIKNLKNNALANFIISKGGAINVE